MGHGCNPGLVTHLCKAALIALASQRRIDISWASSSVFGFTAWPWLAERLSLTNVQFVDRDTQRAPGRPPFRTLVSTWSPQALLAEMRETPIRAVPQGVETTPQQTAWLHKVRAWEPCRGTFIGSLTPHLEVFSVADLLTDRCPVKGAIRYRPTVEFVYQPCPKALPRTRRVRQRS